MRILVTGSRSWTDEAAIRTALDTIAREAFRAGETEIVVVHGCAKGADMMADRWVRQHRLMWPVRPDRRPANWAKFGRWRAGSIRNAEMVADGADVCLAWIAPCEKPKCRRPKPHGTHGASECADLAEEAGIRTVRYVPRPDGSTDG